jgi:biopolymer transport protein ExbD
MGTQSGARTDGPMAEINITPFTDVLLVLLIIFMILAALNTPPGFQKNVPHPTSCVDCNPRTMNNIEVSVTAYGAVTIDGNRVASSHLYDAMASAVRYHTSRAGYSTHVDLAAASAAPYGSIIKVLDAAREAGDDDVGLIVE